MSVKIKDQPFYIQSTAVLFGLILLVFVLAQLSAILIPIAFAAFLAILLNPLCNKLHKLKIPWAVCIAISLFIAILFVAGVFFFLSTQIIQFGDTLPVLEKQLGLLTVNAKQWLNESVGIPMEKQNEMINKALNSGQTIAGKMVGTVLGTVSTVVLLPVYIFFILLYKTLILNFLFEVFAEENADKVSEVLVETKTAIQSYIVGLLIEMIIVAVMNSVALVLLGVKYGILIGCIGAILNLIPYIGGIVAIALPVLMATVTKDGYSTQLGVIAAYGVIQFIDNHVLVPKIVSSKVQINALISIVVVLLGNQLWGLAGMFLSIPFFAVLKIIFDRIDDLKPWGKLLGDSIPTRYRGEMLRDKEKAKAVLPANEQPEK